jgi:FkbM family methyltransferase
MSYPYQKNTIINGTNIEITIRSEADASVFYEIFENKEYSLLDEIIKKTKRPIIDIGAHTGMFSIYASSFNQKVPILAYEPSPDNFETLKKNYLRNKITNIFPKNLAVSSENGQKVLFLKEDSHNHSLVFDEDTNKEQKVFSTDLKSILLKMKSVFDYEESDLLKLDAEGIEYDILKKTDANIIKKFKNIYLEYHELNEENNSEELKIILEKLGFKVSKTTSKYDSRFGFIFARK